MMGRNGFISGVTLFATAFLFILASTGCDGKVNRGQSGDVQQDAVVGIDTADVSTADLSDATSSDMSDTAIPDTAQDTAKSDVFDPQADNDNDGIKNSEEIKLGTDPDDPDSDGDGFGDGWEVKEGFDPLDKKSHPEWVLPKGKPFLIRLTDLNEPKTIKFLVAGQLGRVPPLFLFVEGLTDGKNDKLTIRGGIGEIADPGPDDVVGTGDDLYGLLTTSFSPKDGELRIQLTGTVVDGKFATDIDDVDLDLSGISTLTKGIILTISKAVINGMLDDKLQNLTQGRLKGELTLETIQYLLENVDVNLPLSENQIIALLDPDKNGIVEADFSLVARVVEVVGVIPPKSDALPEPRVPGECCPDGLKVGDPIDSALVIKDQGIQPDEEELAVQFIDILVADPNVDMVVTMRVKPDGRHYYVHATREINGVPERVGIEFKRVREAGKTSYPILEVTKINPLAMLGDPDSDAVLNQLGTIEDFLSSGTNPNKISYPDRGYLTADDERLAFVPVNKMVYPFAYQRLAHMFDDPRTGDLIVMAKSYGKGGYGTHGHLGAPQSRSPLLIMGKGVRNAQNTAPGNGYEIKKLADGTDALFYNKTVKQVDIAPTIGAALQFKKVTGVNKHGYLSDQNYLKWQDGDVLMSAFVNDPAGSNDPAKYAIIIVNDGLNHNELVYQALTSGFNIEGHRKVMRGGITFSGGSISNYPSNTYPGHNAIGTGVWSGHHGIVNNYFFDRELGVDLQPIAMLSNTSFLLGSPHPKLPIETLHDAVHRTFGVFDVVTNSGTLTVSVNDPTSRGSDFSTLETDSKVSINPPSEPTDRITIDGAELILPGADLTDPGGLLDNNTVRTLAHLYQNKGFPTPRFLVVNFTSTDIGGHSYGPHGSVNRDQVIKDTSRRVELFLNVLEKACVPIDDPNCKPFLDQAIIILTSDHGMELQDQSRGGSKTNGLDKAELRYVITGDLLYITTLDLKLSTTTIKKGQKTELVLTVLSGDSQNTGVERVIPGAEVTITSGDQSWKGVADEEGLLTLNIDPTGDELEIDVTAKGFNPYSRTLLTE